MHKTLIAAVILLVVGAGLYYVLTSYQPSPEALSELNQQEVQVEDEMVQEEAGVARGTVMAVSTEQAMVDGPILIMIEQENGSAAVIAVPSMGLPTCAARASMADAFAITVGQFVEVRGSVGVDGMIIPCESAEHYLRVVEPS